MPDNNEKTTRLTMSIFGGIAVAFLALHIAPHISDGLFGIIDGVSEAASAPLKISLCKDSLRTILIFLGIYALCIGVYYSNLRNYRRGEEHGSAKWGNAQAVCRKYRQKPAENNKLLTQHVCIGLDGRKHRRNLNTVVCGGSGAAKTRGFAKPNVMQCNSSMVILDPKGEILRDTGYLLEQKGYEIRVLDLIEPWRSHGYNPFAYIRSDDDVQRISTILMKATDTKKINASAADPFWDRAAEMLLKAIMFYLYHYAPEEEQNFPMVMEMLRAAALPDEDGGGFAPLDELFARLEIDDPDSIALKYYQDYRSGAAKTLKSIQLTLAARLEKFNLESIAGMTTVDEMDLPSIGEKRVALYCKIPDNDTSFNFLVSILYTQIFQSLTALADNKYYGELPVRVHVIMDEFANVALPDDFDKILSTIRSRGIFCSIILQNLAQLKALYDKQWESIVGNCDEFLYLGGNEESTHEYVSKLLGKETIDVNSYGRTRGRNGSYSINYQLSGRELMTPDEVRRLDNRYALLFVRGEAPIMDLKYDILRHSNVGLTADGEMPPYIHGETTLAKATISTAPVSEGSELKIDSDELKKLASRYELLTEAELEEQFKNLERKKRNDEKKTRKKS